MWDFALGKVIMTFLVSMVPVVELRGAIPLGVAHDLPVWLAVCASILGNMVPVPFIIIFIRKIFALLRKHAPRLDGAISKLEARAAKKSDVVLKCSFWGLFVLVAIPLPGTGAWTGALIAAMLEMRLKRAFPSIFLGVVTAGIVVGLATKGVIHIF